jgi:hypothetical protein
MYQIPHKLKIARFGGFYQRKIIDAPHI